MQKYAPRYCHLTRIAMIPDGPQRLGLDHIYRFHRSIKLIYHNLQHEPGEYLGWLTIARADWSSEGTSISPMVLTPLPIPGEPRNTNSKALIAIPSNRESPARCRSVGAAGSKIVIGRIPMQGIFNAGCMHWEWYNAEVVCASCPDCVCCTNILRTPYNMRQTIPNA